MAARWEYKVCHWGRQSLADTLFTAGRDGWECIDINNEHSRLVFKRPAGGT